MRSAICDRERVDMLESEARDQILSFFRRSAVGCQVFVTAVT